MILVNEALDKILSTCFDPGTEQVHLDQATGRILAEDLIADRDFPPYDRVAMDGICIRYEAYRNGARSFPVLAKIAAGEPQNELSDSTTCFEIMTGASLPRGADTVIRYEDLHIRENQATILVNSVKEGQNVHVQGTDRSAGDLLQKAPSRIRPVEIGVAATIGKDPITVKKWPKIILISSGDELVDVREMPLPHQIRKSNTLTLKAIFNSFNIPVNIVHLPDDEQIIHTRLEQYIREYDVVIISGGVSKGKFDFLPGVLDRLGVEKLFHRVKQKPGKPFWFGMLAQSCRVFAFPGNPVSTYTCFWVYFMPWFRRSLGLENRKWNQGILMDKLEFKSRIDYFVPIKWGIENGKVLLNLYPGRGSGDHANLVRSNGVAHFPAYQYAFNPGEPISFLPTNELLL